MLSHLTGGRMRLVHNVTAESPGAARLALAFTDCGVRLCFDGDSEIYAQGDPAERLYKVVRGVVRTSRVTCDGGRHVGGFYYPGDTFGFEPGPEHRFAAESLSGCEILAVRAASPARSADGDLGRAILQAAHREIERLQDHVGMLSRMSARGRLAAFLMDVARRRSGEPSGLRHVDLPMSRRDIADYLGLTIETVSRTLTQLQEDALVSFHTSRRFGIPRWAALAAIAA